MVKSGLLSLIIGVLLSFSAAPPVANAEDIKVSLDEAQNKFPNEILFRLRATGPADIIAVTLLYRTKDGDALSRAPADVQKGKSVTAEYSLNTKKTYLPPGTELTYYWEIEDTAGTKLKTELRQFTYDDTRFTWHKVSRDGLSIYYYKGTEAFADGLANVATDAIQRLSNQIGISYDKPMKIWVYDSKQDMSDALPKRSDAYEAQTTTLGVRLSAEVMLLLGSHPDVKETLAHELSHMVVHQATDNPYGDIPSWLDEGLAMYAEGNLSASHANALAAAVKANNLLSIRQLTSYSGDASAVTLYYAESYSVVKFLIDTYGRDKIRELLGVFKEGSAYDAALKKVYQFDQDGLDAKWRESLGAPPRSAQSSTRSTGTPQPKPTLAPLGSETPSGRLPTVGILAVGCSAAVVVLGVGFLAVVLVRRR